MFAMFRRWLAQPRISPLKVEQRNLERALAQTYVHMDGLERTFWSSGGICCPSCGVPGFSVLVDKQERRLVRLKQIRDKLKRDSVNRNDTQEDM
jgi:hypothetical protein